MRLSPVVQHSSGSNTFLKDSTLLKQPKWGFDTAFSLASTEISPSILGAEMASLDKGDSKRLQHFCTGLWSQIKRAPKASIKRKTFEVEGPAKAGAQSLDIRAKQIFLYFQKYNYEVKQTGETITFSGTYAASRGQAAALVFYVFVGEYFQPLHSSTPSSYLDGNDYDKG